jgi:hypothetical protein
MRRLLVTGILVLGMVGVLLAQGGIAHAKGGIDGTVTDDSTGLPIAGVAIRFFSRSALVTYFPVVLTDNAGQYRAVLDTGTYLIQAVPNTMMMNILPPYRAEWYNNATKPQDATPVPVTDGSEFTADFGLSRFLPPVLATVRGIVTDTLGHPLSHATVVFLWTFRDVDSLAATTGLVPGTGDEAMDVEGLGYCRGVLWRGWTDSTGHYEAHVIAGRSHIALATKLGYLPEYYNNKSHPLEADVIPVAHDTSGIDFSLAPSPAFANSISGTVRDSTGTGVPSRIVLIPIHPIVWHWKVRFGHTDSSGSYTIGAVQAGRYFVLAIPFAHYAPAFFKAGAYGVMRWKDADTVNAGGDVTGIDIGVVRVTSEGFAHLGGKVITGNGVALEGVRVSALDARGRPVGIGVTDVGGRYMLDALPAGSLQVVADLEGYDGAQAVAMVAAGSTSPADVNLTLTATGPLAVQAGETLPEQFVLHQNYPNPFNPSTRITFELPTAAVVRVTVYGTLGQEIATLKNGPMPAGRNEIVWQGHDRNGLPVASGVYLYRVTATAGGRELLNQVRKMVLLR